MEENISELKRAIEIQHGGEAIFSKSVPVKEEFMGDIVWEGIVNIFELNGHDKANRAYAWSSPIENSPKRKYFSVLHVGPVDSPEKAVKAAIVTEYKNKVGQDTK